ncbi:MAG TPA: LuxR C-terminal-related transcriptional regulator [Streptosporangiaceae bacterium]|nr:LuxR C-terminal-related transcriptional regulator [Streptosporangiaceae bacterium]
MAGTWARTAARERVAAISAAAHDSRELRRQVLPVLGEVLGFEGYVWLLTDPVTTVGAAPLAHVPGLADMTGLPAIIRAKYATTANRWTTLGPPGSPAGLWSAVASGQARSPAWREVLRRHGTGDVASVVFTDQFGCWGFLDLWRAAGRGPFAAADAEFLAGLAAPLTAGLRRCQALTFTSVAAAHRGDTGPVALTLDDDLRILFRTAASRAWLEVLLPPQPDERAVPASVYNVAAQLLAAEAGIDDHPASARTHLAGGFWLTLRAARLAAETPGPPGSPAMIVVTIEEASAAERLEIFGRAWGLTARERELLGVLAAGGDTRAIARQLGLSEHTVQDHLKAIFSKTGARDRVTVLSRALGTRGRAGG